MTALNDDTIRRVLRTWADDAAAFADVLAEQDPTWGSDQFSFGGGRAVLCGAGMYVNRALAAGFDGAIADDDWLMFEHRCQHVGLTPTLEVSPVTSAVVVRQLRERRYQPSDTTAALFRSLDDLDALAATNSPITIESVALDRLRLWQKVSASGWGHTTAESLRASNAFAAAAAVVDRDHLLIAFDRDLGHPLGCASMTVRNGIATLGGMSTLPTERRRGVQAALIVHRLRAARELGCDFAMSTADPDEASERNLIRQGFEPCFQLESYVGPLPGVDVRGRRSDGE